MCETPELPAEADAIGMDFGAIKTLLAANDPGFWHELDLLTGRATEFDVLISLCALRRKAASRGLPRPGTSAVSVRLAILGGYSLYPLHELLVHLLDAEGFTSICFWATTTISFWKSWSRRARCTCIGPTWSCCCRGQRSKYPGELTDPRDAVEAAAGAVGAPAGTLPNRASAHRGRKSCWAISCCRRGMIQASFARGRSHRIWNFLKWTNLRLGLDAPSVREDL